MSVKNQLEALLFSSGKAMEEEQLGTIVGKDARVVKAALQELKKDYEGRDTALRLFNEATLWKLLVKDEHLSLVRRIVADTELTRATLETLAIIAYNQPKALQSKVVELRGGNAYEHIKELLELGFITKTKEGRSYAIRLTEKFYDYFDVEGDDSIRKVFDEVKKPNERQRVLAGLSIVDTLPESEKDRKVREDKELLGGLEVVEESDAPEFSDAPAKLEVSKDEKKENEGFLAKLEKQIDSLSMRNDEREHDDELKPTSAPADAPEAASEPATDEERQKESDIAETLEGVDASPETEKPELGAAPEPATDEERQKESDIAETLEGVDASPETEKPELGAAPEAPKENPEL